MRHREEGLGEDDIAERLKSEREARGLSQRQLANACGVTASMISVMEQGRTSPSIATLKKVLSGLNMSLSDFFSDTALNREKWHFTRDELLEINPEAKFGSHGDDAARSISFRQVGNTSQSAIQMLHEHYPPGADTGSERYSHEAEEAGIVVEGEIEITVGDETRTLKKGDAYLFNSRLAHRFRNSGDRDCIIVSACTPPTF